MSFKTNWLEMHVSEVTSVSKEVHSGFKRKNQSRDREDIKKITCWVKLVVSFYVFSCVWTKHDPYSPLRSVSFGPCNDLLWLHIHPIAVPKTKTFHMENNGEGLNLPFRTT